MKARIRTETFTFEYSGPPRLWNEIFRPIVGGAKSPDEVPEPVPETRAAPPPAHSGARRPANSPLAPIARSPFAGAAPMPAGPAAYGDVDLPRGGQQGQGRDGDRGSDRRGGFEPRRQEPYRDQRGGRDRGPDQNRDRRDAGPPADRAPRKPRLAPQAPPIERSGEPSELYSRLGEIPGRRSEKDSVLAAVWFVSKGERDVTPEEIEQHFRDHNGPTDVKVRPLLQKHVNRSKMLDAGANSGTFRMNRKGAHYVVDHLVGS